MRKLYKSLLTLCHFDSLMNENKPIRGSKEFEKPTDKNLSIKGKQKLIRIIDEYINTKIDLRTLCIRPNLNQEEVEQRIAKAREDFEKTIMALKISVE